MTTGELNLRVDREGPSIWHQKGWQPASAWPSAGQITAGVVGAGLVALGIARRTPIRSVMALAGIAVVVQAAYGCKDLSGLWEAGRRIMARFGHETLDQVGTTSADSFPASDAPSWTPTAGPQARE